MSDEYYQTLRYLMGLVIGRNGGHERGDGGMYQQRVGDLRGSVVFWCIMSRQNKSMLKP